MQSILKLLLWLWLFLLLKAIIYIILNKVQKDSCTLPVHPCPFSFSCRYSSQACLLKTGKNPCRVFMDQKRTFFINLFNLIPTLQVSTPGFLESDYFLPCPLE